MSLDVMSLMLVTTLILAVSALVLAGHWLVNISFIGLGRIAAAFGAATIGMILLTTRQGEAFPICILLGDLLILLGQLWIWLGIADFWGARNRGLTYLACGILALAIVTMTYNLVHLGSLAARAAMFSYYTAALSFGGTISMVRALGGRVGFYKGIIKRTTIGAGIVTGILFVHGLAHLNRAVLMPSLETPEGFQNNALLAQLTQLEGLLFVVGFMIAIIVMTAERVQADLKIQAMMDPLTQALNRRAFMAVIKTVVARSRRLSEPVSLVMMDIDRFKRINTKYGHLVGDAVLGQFAEGVMEGRRAQDVFCRFGGEEFVLLLPGTSEEGAMLVAERVRDAVTGYPFQYGDKAISLTVSFGVMTGRGDDLMPDGMLDLAFKALKQAQKNGANHIVAGSSLRAAP